MKNKINSVVLKNSRTGEIWVCDNYTVRREIDGAQFIEVHKSDSTRTMWININSVERVRENNQKSLIK